ncbi:MAG: hypothetical protein R3E97_09400 [Candidatus Eisenbacteria bacterium]
MNRRALFFAFASAFIAISSFAGASFAGPNAYGFLHFHTNDSIIYTADDVASYEGFGYASCEPTANCPGPEDACIAELLGMPASSGIGGETAVFWLVAVFPSGCPRISGAQFGITWPESHHLNLVDWGTCGDFELPTAGWPTEPNSGVAVTWTEAQTEYAVPIYWFAAYAYDTIARVSLTPFPDESVPLLADDSIPSVLDAIALQDCGVFGLNGGYGFNPFPGSIDPQDEIGSCCLPDGTCRAMGELECRNSEGTFLGANVPCSPNCFTPVAPMSWGKVKSNFRGEPDGDR